MCIHVLYVLQCTVYMHVCAFDWQRPSKSSVLKGNRHELLLMLNKSVHLYEIKLTLLNPLIVVTVDGLYMYIVNNRIIMKAKAFFLPF